jgi:hypothetical protein
LYTPPFFRLEDAYLVPICLLAIVMISRGFHKKYRGSLLGKYFVQALFFRILFCFLQAFIMAFYYGGGDTTMYYQVILDMHKAIEDDFSFLNDIYGTLSLYKTDRIYPYFQFDELGFTHYFILSSNNYMVPRFGLPFSLIFSKSYLCISLCISFFSFAGCWRLFKMFYNIFPHLHKKIAIATLFLPSVLFWGVSLLKDSICMGALGLFCYAFYMIFFKKEKKRVSVLILLFSGFLLFNIKVYIFLCIVPAFFLWLFIDFNKRIADRTLRTVSKGLVAIVSLLAAFFLIQQLTSNEAAKGFSADNLFESISTQQKSFSYFEGSGSNFSVTKFDNSITGLLVLFPQGVVNSFFRPFPWDVKSPLMVLSFFEAFGFLILTLMAFFRIGFFKTFSIIFSNPISLFCFVFAVFFGGIIGFTTYNFGALSRYKIPCLPFYLMMLFIAMDYSKKFSPNIIFSKKFF